MSYTPSYPQRINFENDPSTATPLNQTNLNKMDNALYQHDRALSAQDERISDLEGEDKVTSFKGRTGVVTPADDDYTIAQIKATGSEGQIPALNAQGKLAMVTPNKAGHDIVDKVGNVMTTRDNLQFVGAVSVTDDSTNNKTIVNVTGGGGGGGGHTIEDTDATTMPQEENLQFVGVYTEDDATNDRTKVNIVREMTSAQMQSLTTAQKKGFIHTTDEPDATYGKTSASDVILSDNETDVQEAITDLRNDFNRNTSVTNPCNQTIKPYAITDPSTTGKSAVAYDLVIQNSHLYIRTYDNNGDVIAWFMVTLTPVSN